MNAKHGVLALVAGIAGTLLPPMPSLLRHAERHFAQQAERRRQRELWELSPAPAVSMGDAFVVEDQREGSFWVMGGLRVRVDADLGLRVAVHRTMAAIVQVVRAKDGWLFLTAQGVVFGADDFLGEPVFVAKLDDVSREYFPSEGRLILRVGGSVGSVTRSAGWKAFDEPEHIVTSSFVNEQDGVALTDDGRAWVSHDGGHAWKVVESASARGLLLQGGTLAVDTTGGPVALLQGRRIEPLAPNLAEERRGRVEKFQARAGPLTKRWHPRGLGLPRESVPDLEGATQPWPMLSAGGLHASRLNETLPGYELLRPGVRRPRETDHANEQRTSMEAPYVDAPVDGARHTDRLASGELLVRAENSDSMNHLSGVAIVQVSTAQQQSVLLGKWRGIDDRGVYTIQTEANLPEESLNAHFGSSEILLLTREGMLFRVSGNQWAQAPGGLRRHGSRQFWREYWLGAHGTLLGRELPDPEERVRGLSLANGTVLILRQQPHRRVQLEAAREQAGHAQSQPLASLCITTVEHRGSDGRDLLAERTTLGSSADDEGVWALGRDVQGRWGLLKGGIADGVSFSFYPLETKVSERWEGPSMQVTSQACEAHGGGQRVLYFRDLPGREYGLELFTALESPPWGTITTEDYSVSPQGLCLERAEGFRHGWILERLIQRGDDADQEPVPTRAYMHFARSARSYVGSFDTGWERWSTRAELYVGSQTESNQVNDREE